MLYISGPNDTLQDLMAKQGVKGSSSESNFAKLNPELCAKYPDYKRKLPPYSPIFLEEPFDPSTRADVVNGILLFGVQERQTLKEMQDSNFDIPTQIALTDIMEELQNYAKGFRKWLKAPLVVTPWTEINSCLTDKSLFRLTGETLKFGSDTIKSSGQFNILDKLYEDMLARDLLNRQLYMLRNQKEKEVIGLKRDLERQIKDLTARIKQQLPKKIASKRNKYVSNRFTDAEMRKMRANSFSAKGARTGKPVTTNLDVLNKTGLARLKMMMNGFKKLGNGINKAATMINYGVVAYDAAEAFKSSGSKEAAKTFITGASAVFLTSQAVTAMGGTSVLGGLVLGSLAGDAAIGSTLLICSPVLGWVIVIVAGVATAGYIGYKAKGVLEGVWDLAEEVGGQFYEMGSKAAVWAHEELQRAWSYEPQWVLDFYDKKR